MASKSAEDFQMPYTFRKAGFVAVEYQKHGGGAIASHFATKSKKPKSNIRIGKK